LDFEGVHGDIALGNDETEEAPDGDAEHALERVQANVILTTPLEDDSQIIKVLSAFLGPSGEVV
jgi:hypothetical protein